MDKKTFEEATTVSPLRSVPLTDIEQIYARLLQEEDDQKRIAYDVFDRVMERGAQRFGLEWYLIHQAIADIASEEYLPQGGMNGDARIKAAFAEIAYAILDQYRLVKRGSES